MNRSNQTLSGSAVGFAAGLICGLLGAGGGLLLLPVLRRRGLPTAQCHATMLAVTVPLAVLSGAFYLLRGHVALSQLLPYLPGGAVGAVLGSLLLPRIRPRLLRVVFALFLLYSGLRFTGILQWLGVAP